MDSIAAHSFWPSNGLMFGGLRSQLRERSIGERPDVDLPDGDFPSILPSVLDRSIMDLDTESTGSSMSIFSTTITVSSTVLSSLEPLVEWSRVCGHEVRLTICASFSSQLFQTKNVCSFEVISSHPQCVSLMVVILVGKIIS